VSRLGVVFEVPPAIEAGMRAGRYRLTGGVVRDISDGQKIAVHLKQAHPLRSLDPQGIPAVLSSVTAVASVANLAVSVAGFALVLHRLSKLEGQVQQLAVGMSRVESKLDQVTAVTKTIEKLGWASVIGRLHSAIELADRATRVSSTQLAMHHAADALGKLSQVSSELRRLAVDEEIDISIRATCAQMVVLAGMVTAALYARLEEDDAADHVIRSLPESTGALRAATRLLYQRTPLVLHYHPRLTSDTTSTTLKQLFDWSDAELRAELAKSFTSDLGHGVPADGVHALIDDKERFASVLTAAATRGHVHLARQAPLILKSSFAAKRSVALSQTAESYQLQAEDGRRLGRGPAVWDRVVVPTPPEKAELAFLVPADD